MRFQWNLSLFLLGLVTTSMVEASGKKPHKKRKAKKVKQRNIPLHSILDDDSAVAEHEVLVSQLSTPPPPLINSPRPTLGSESSTQRLDEININVIHSSSSLSSANEKGVTESGRTTRWDRLETAKDVMSLIQNVNDVEIDDPSFIVDSIKRLNLVDKDILTALCSSRSLDVMRQAIEQLEFPQHSLAHAASEPAVFYSPEKLNYLFTKIHDSKDLKWVIQNGIKKLFSNDQMNMIPGALKFLEGQVLLGINLHGIAIQTTFLEASERHDAWLTNYCQGYSTIDSETYADALVCAGRGDLQYPFFQELIARADMNDLKKVSFNSLEGSKKDKFRAAIDSAVTKADVGGTRLNFPIMTAWMTRNVLDKDLNIGMPRAIIDTIIIPYITDEQLAARKVGVEEEGGIMTQPAQLPNLFKELMEGGHYGVVCNMARRMGREIFKHHLYSSITAVEHYAELYGYLNDNFLLEDFLVNGMEAGVTAAIQGTKTSDKAHLRINTISRALNTVFKDDNFDRVACLLVALKRRCERSSFVDLSTVMQYMFTSVTSMDDLSVRAKHFLVLHGNELNDKHFVIHEAFCKELGKTVRARCTGSQASGFLAVLAQQPIPLSASALVKGLLSDGNLSQVPACLEGLTWREFHQSLIFDDQEKGGELWLKMKRSVPLKYFGGYPSSAEARHAFLNGFRFRNELQMEWLLSELDAILKRHDDAFCILPFALLSLIAEYMIQ
jgi:hypothetical protein